MLDQRRIDAISSRLFKGKITIEQINCIEHIIFQMADRSIDEQAYALATAHWETNTTMQPVNEAYWLSGKARNEYLTNMYDVTGRRPATAKKYGNTSPGDGIKYAGRGLVQLTWKNNYKKAGAGVGLDLVAEPELALRLPIAVRILVSGMANGWFTGKKFSDYFGEDKCDFINARRIINGTDKAVEIADLAKLYKDALIQPILPTPVKPKTWWEWLKLKMQKG